MNTQDSVFLSGEADEWYLRNPRNEQNSDYFEVSAISRALKPFSSELNNLLEIGSGDGRKLSSLCSFLNASGEGIDPSTAAVKEGNKQFSNVNLQVGLSSELPFKENQFDVVIFGFCLYLVDRTSIYRTISEADRVLKPGGYLVIVDFDPGTFYKTSYKHLPGIFSFKNSYSDFFTTAGHYYQVSKESFSHRSPHFIEERNERISVSVLYKEKDSYPNIVFKETKKI